MQEEVTRDLGLWNTVNVALQLVINDELTSAFQLDQGIIRIFTLGAFEPFELIT